MRNILSVLTIVVGFNVFCLGGPLFVEAKQLPVFYQGVRPLGMGGAFTAVADDENAMFYNPAGLNKVEGFGGLQLVPPQVSLSENTIDFARDLQDLESTASDAEQAVLASDLLNKFLGEHLHLRASLFPSFTMHNFGLGVLAQGVFDGEVHNALGANVLEVDARADLALLGSFALGFNLLGRPLSLGVTGKAVRREKLDQTYSANDLVQTDGIDFDRDKRDGSGIGFDLGMIYVLPVIMKPSVGVTLQNVGDLDLGDAGDMKQQLNAGVAVPLPIPIGLGKAVAAVDVVDITKAVGTDDDLAKRMHAGLEYKLPLILTLRGGLHQGYGSVGASIDFWLLKLDYAYYAEEIGAFAGQQEDYRHALQLTLGF